MTKDLYNYKTVRAFNNASQIIIDNCWGERSFATELLVEIFYSSWIFLTNWTNDTPANFMSFYMVHLIRLPLICQEALTHILRIRTMDSTPSHLNDLIIRPKHALPDSINCFYDSRRRHTSSILYNLHWLWAN